MPARFSTVQRDNGDGFFDEGHLLSVEYEDNILGSVTRFSFQIGNPRQDSPTIVSGTHDGANNNDNLIDSTANFQRDLVFPGDVVRNDASGLTRVVRTVAATQLTLLTSGIDFDAGEAYTVLREAKETTYQPLKTTVRALHPDFDKIYFEGVVEDISPIEPVASRLRVQCVGRAVDLRDAASRINFAARIRSRVIQGAVDEQNSGSWVTPFVSAFEEAPGFENGLSKDTISPNMQQATQGLLSMFQKFAQSEAWCPAVLENPTNPFLDVNTDDNFTELASAAHGNLAQSFRLASDQIIQSIELTLQKIDGPPTLTGNIYIRIETEDDDASILGEGVPSRRLCHPAAESRLVNADDDVNVPIDPATGQVTFRFPEPFVLQRDTTYWIVLSYQENNNNFGTGVTAVQWRRANTSVYGSGTAATYSGSPARWAANTDRDMIFQVNAFQNAVWHFDRSGAAWTDRTVAALSADDSRFNWMEGATEDRLYMRFAGPVQGVILDHDATVANAEYGALTARYFSDHHAKATGRHNGAMNAATLSDSLVDFRTFNVVVGDIVYNQTDGSWGVITALTGATLTAVLQGEAAADLNWDTGDNYIVISWESLLTGTATAGTTTRLTDAGADFGVSGVKEGDIVVNTTRNTVGLVIAYATTTIDVDANVNMQWQVGDAYRVWTRWRTLSIQSDAPAFIVLGSKRIEWEMPPDWIPIGFDAGAARSRWGPEANVPGGSLESQAPGYWVVFQYTSIPATRAEIDQVTPLRGFGYEMSVAPETHRDVVLLQGTRVHDGAANAVNLRDSGEDFINTHGILIGDIVENLTDGSSGTITVIQTNVPATTTNDTIVAALTGGTDNDWDAGDRYRILRDRYKLNYFRRGSRPFGRPSVYGLTLQRNVAESDQALPVTDWKFPHASRGMVNRVIVKSLDVDGTSIESIVNNLRSQREYGITKAKTVVDYTLLTVQELTDRGNAILGQFRDEAERGETRVEGFPFFTRTAERISWGIDGRGLLQQLDNDNAGGTFAHDGGAVSDLVDASVNFRKYGVEVGDRVTNLTQVFDRTVTGFATTTNEDDTLVLSGTTNWTNADRYRVAVRRPVRAGDLVQVRVNDPGYVDDYYLVVRISYNEPGSHATVALARSLLSPSLGDPREADDIIRQLQDDARMALQRQSLGSGVNWQNVVIVAGSGGDFTTIQGAIDSIAGESATNRFLVWVHPDDYNEAVTMKPFVDVVGSAREAVRILGTGLVGAVVTGAVDCVLSNLTIVRGTASSYAFTSVPILSNFIMQDVNIEGKFLFPGGKYFNVDSRIIDPAETSSTLEARINNDAEVHGSSFLIKRNVNGGEIDFRIMSAFSCEFLIDPASTGAAAGGTPFSTDTSNFVSKFYGCQFRDLGTNGHSLLQGGGEFHGCKFEFETNRNDRVALSLNQDFGLFGCRVSLKKKAGATGGKTVQTFPAIDGVIDGCHISMDGILAEVYHLNIAGSAGGTTRITGTVLEFIGITGWCIQSPSGSLASTLELNGNRYVNGFANFSNVNTVIRGSDVHEAYYPLQERGTSTPSTQGDHPTRLFNAAAETGFCSIRLHELAPIQTLGGHGTALYILYIPVGTGSVDITVNTDWAKPGEALGNHSDSAAFAAVPCTNMSIGEVNVSTAFNATTAQGEDIVGIEIVLDAFTTVTEWHVLGVKLRYVAG